MKEIYVGNLPYSIDEDELRAFFQEYDPENVKLIKDNYTGQSKGFAFIAFSDESVATKAAEDKNGESLGGRTLKVNLARPKEGGAGGRGGKRAGATDNRW